MASPGYWRATEENTSFTSTSRITAPPDPLACLAREALSAIIIATWLVRM